jgi:hypothetical protein
MSTYWTKTGIMQGSRRFYKRRPVPRLPKGSTPDLVQLANGETAQIWTDGWHVVEGLTGTRRFVRSAELDLP